MPKYYDADGNQLTFTQAMKFQTKDPRGYVRAQQEHAEQVKAAKEAASLTSKPDRSRHQESAEGTDVYTDDSAPPTADEGDAPSEQESLRERIRRARNGAPRNADERRERQRGELTAAAERLGVPDEQRELTEMTGLGEGKMEGLDGEWFSDEAGLYFGHMISTGVSRARDLRLYLRPGDLVLPVLAWSAVTGLEIFGTEGSTVHTQVQGSEREPLALLRSTIKESHVTRVEGSAVLHFQLQVGPDRVLTLSDKSPSKARSLLAARLGEVRRGGLAASAGAPTGHSLADELSKLADLLDRGLLTPDEFSAQKARLLDG